MKVVLNDRKYLNEFSELNNEWIKKYFELEESDLELTKNPGKIIEEGGYIFTIVVNKEAAGVCALFNKGNGKYEIARMAVKPSYQGKGYGKKLLSLCLEKLRELSAKNIYLVSNTILEPAINMYKSFGFITTHLGQHPEYKRANIIMEYPIDNFVIRADCKKSK